MTDDAWAAQEIAWQAAERFHRVDRYLDRDAALTAADWGRLDAAGQQLYARDPLARWRLARRFAQEHVGPPLRAPFTVFILGMEVALQAVHALDGDRGLTHWFASFDDPARPRSAELERMGAQVRRLYEIAATKPGGPGAAVACLGLGLMALHSGRAAAPDTVAGLYSTVEPVIPFASL